MKKISLTCLCLTLLIAGCYREKDFDNVNISSDAVITNIAALKYTLLATGTDSTTVYVDLPLTAADALSTVLFTANTGTFLETTKNTATAAASLIRVNGLQTRRAKVTFQAPASAGTAIITAKVGNYAKTLNLTLQTNYADGLKITPSALTVAPTAIAELTFTVSLSSMNGLVTPGQAVTLTVKDQNNLDRGTFRVQNNKSDAAGNCSFVYSLMPDTAARGKLTVRALAVTPAGSPVDQVTIFINK